MNSFVESEDLEAGWYGLQMLGYQQLLLMIIIGQYILRYLYATVQNINYLLLTVIWKLFQEGSESLL